MPGVGVGQQHGVWEMLAQHIGIADWNHIVEDAVNDQARLRDFGELGEALATVLFPGAKGRDLSDCDILAGQRLTILFSLGEASCEGFSCRLTRLAWSEKEFHQFLQPRHIRIFRNLPEFRLSMCIMSSPPCGAVATRSILWTSEGRSSATCCATIPPREYPRISKRFRPSASTNARACAAIPIMLSGTWPVERPRPALSKRITSRPRASGSVTAGSQLSRVPVKC